MFRLAFNSKQFSIKFSSLTSFILSFKCRTAAALLLHLPLPHSIIFVFSMNWVFFLLLLLLCFSFRLTTSTVRCIFLFVTAFSVTITQMIVSICFYIWHLNIHLHTVAWLYRTVTQRILPSD